MSEFGFFSLTLAESLPTCSKNCFLEKFDSCSLYDICTYLIFTLLLLLVLQSIQIYRLKKQTQKSSHVSDSELTKNSTDLPSQKDLPNPGLTYRFVVSEISPKRTIVIGQKKGTVKTYSTEITEEHLKIQISKTSLKGSETSGYRIEMQRGGKVLYSLPSSRRLVEMPHRIHLFLNCPSPSGEPSYENLSSRNPLRLRLGDKLTHTQKFLRGYLEFHLFAKESQKTPGSSKEFCLKLFRIYPGYDTASQNEEGLFPMLEPFQRGQ